MNPSTLQARDHSTLDSLHLLVIKALCRARVAGFGVGCGGGGGGGVLYQLKMFSFL